MRVFRSSLFSIALALLVAGPAQAQLTCDELVFDAEARANYPEVNEACLEVVVRDGANYARFHARVVQPGSNSIGTSLITIGMLPPKGHTCRIRCILV